MSNNVKYSPIDDRSFELYGNRMTYDELQTAWPAVMGGCTYQEEGAYCPNPLTYDAAGKTWMCDPDRHPVRPLEPNEAIAALLGVDFNNEKLERLRAGLALVRGTLLVQGDAVVQDRQPGDGGVVDVFQPDVGLEDGLLQGKLRGGFGGGVGE